MKPILIAGGGIGGLTLAALLSRQNIKTQVLERAGQFKARGAALSVMGNALIALRPWGLDKEFEKASQHMTSLDVRDDQDRRIFFCDFKRINRDLHAPSINIHRADLQNLLLQWCDGVEILNSAGVTDFSCTQGGVEVATAQGGFSGEALIGADGIHSQVREVLSRSRKELLKHPIRTSKFNAWLSTVSFSHPQFPPGAVIHYWGRGMRMGLIDLGKQRLYWWITMNKDLGKPAGDTLAWLKKQMAKWPDLALAALEASSSEILAVETQDRLPCDIWGDGPVTLLGDAAHPMLTSLGQGAGFAIEDAAVLSRILKQKAHVPTLLRCYESARYHRAAQVTRLARQVAWYEQLAHPTSTWLRNQIFRSLPPETMENQTLQLLNFQFNEVHV